MKVVGIQEMKGVSKKTGKPYDSVVLYLTGEAKDVVGCITDNIWVPRDVWDSQVGEPVSDAFIFLPSKVVPVLLVRRFRFLSFLAIVL